MVYISSEGDIIINGSWGLDGGNQVMDGTKVLTDGSILLNLQDHTIPIYALASNLHHKATIGVLINYSITLSCTNNADPGKELIVDVPIPSGFTYVNSYSNEGTYDSATGKWTLTMDNQEAILNLSLNPITAGSQPQTVTLEGTITTLTSTCVISSSDSDGSIASHEIPLANYPFTLSNMKDGQTYTVVMYSKVHESDITGIHDGVKNNRIELINGETHSNKAPANVATGTDYEGTTDGFNPNQGTETLDSSTEWFENGTKSLKCQTPGNVVQEGIWTSPMTLEPLTNHVARIYLKATSQARLTVNLIDLPSYDIIDTVDVVGDGEEQIIDLAGITDTHTSVYISILTKDYAQAIDLFVDEVIVIEGTVMPEGYVDLETGNFKTGFSVLGTRATLQNIITKTIVCFVYDSEYPVIIRRNDQYHSISTAGQEDWYGCCINEGYNTEYSQSKDLFSNPSALLIETEQTAILLEGASESVEYIYEIPASETLSSQFFTGVLISLTSKGLIASGLEIQIITEDGIESSVKSTYINSPEDISFGSIGDKWGLTEDEIQNKKLYVHLKVKNTTLNEQSFTYSDLKLILYYSDNEIGDANTVIYNGEHGKIYGLFITGDNNPEGASYDLETLKLNMMDGELPIRFNIQSKELEIDFTVCGNTLEESQRKLRMIRSWFANVRNNMTIPSLNSLIFTYDTSVEYFVIFKDVIEVEKEICALHCTAKFSVPEGVARAVNYLVSGPKGNNPGEIRVWPLIEVKSDGTGPIIIVDNETGLTVTLNTSVTANTTLIFDCAKRTVADDAGTDYTTNLGLNTAWINFMGKADYDLSITGGILQQVSFKPGY